MATKQISHSVVTRFQDNGDGGWTMYAYNNQDEMLADHPMAEKFIDGKFVKVALTEKQKTEILTENDPYKNGYIGSDKIELEIDDTGTIRLAKPLHFHAGQ